jgi:hypothetical protein
VAASFSAPVLTRRKEFGLLVHLELTLPYFSLLALSVAVILAGTLTAWLAGRDTVMVVKEDW